MKGFAGILALLAVALPGRAQEGETGFAVTPPFNWVTDSAPRGTFRVSNTGTRPVEIITTVEYGIIASSEDGAETGVVTGAGGAMEDLSAALVIFPPRWIMEPGEERVVRYSVRDASVLAEGGHVALVFFNMGARAEVGPEGAVPAPATGVEIRYSIVTPVVLISGEGQTAISAVLHARSDTLAVLMLENNSPWPWAGKVSLTSLDGQVIYGDTRTMLFTRRVADIRLATPLPEGEAVQVVFDVEYPSIPRQVLARLTAPRPVIIRL